MASFSTVLMTPEVRQLIQENFLERAFHDVLFPQLIFRGEAVAKEWPLAVGDTYIATGNGLMPVSARPLGAGQDPTPVSYPMEQWEVSLQKYGGTIDTDMPTSVTAISSLLVNNVTRLGLHAAQTMNAIVRAKLYNAAESGHTVADGSGSSSTSIRVKRLNGFTRARRPDLAGASAVRFNPVSSANPLVVSINGVANTVIGAQPDVTGDEVGPGVLTLGTAATWSDRDAVLSYDRSNSFNVGGGYKVDDLGSNDLPRMQDVRYAVSRLMTDNVPVHGDGNYHAHLSPEGTSAMFKDPELLNLNTGALDSYMYSDFVIGRKLNVLFIRNNQVPTRDNVLGASTGTYTGDDPCGFELTNNGAGTGMGVERILFSGAGSIEEYFQNPGIYVTDVGVTGKMADMSPITNNGVEITVDRVKLIMRAPTNRLQDQVSTSWLFVGGWAMRTDACAPGSNARHKRLLVMRHGREV